MYMVKVACNNIHVSPASWFPWWSKSKWEKNHPLSWKAESGMLLLSHDPVRTIFSISASSSDSVLSIMSPFYYWVWTFDRKSGGIAGLLALAFIRASTLILLSLLVHCFLLPFICLWTGVTYSSILKSVNLPSTALSLYGTGAVLFSSNNSAEVYLKKLEVAPRARATVILLLLPSWKILGNNHKFPLLCRWPYCVKCLKLYLLIKPDVTKQLVKLLKRHKRLDIL